jgi:long-subunit fatty acid transport protein
LFNRLGHDSYPPPHGIEVNARALLDASTAYAGSGDLSLPYKIQAGVRNRYNQLMTWEVDLRYMGSSAIKLPMQPGLNTPLKAPIQPVQDTQGSQVSTQERDYGFRDCFALSAMMEINVNRNWAARVGIAYDNALRKGQEADAMLGGARSASYSLGLSHMIFGGELSVGYQLRQAQDREVYGVEGIWSASGLRATDTLTRVEGMGHILSFGFKKSF